MTSVGQSVNTLQTASAEIARYIMQHGARHPGPPFPARYQVERRLLDGRDLEMVLVTDYDLSLQNVSKAKIAISVMPGSESQYAFHALEIGLTGQLGGYTILLGQLQKIGCPKIHGHGLTNPISFQRGATNGLQCMLQRRYDLDIKA